MDEWISVEDRLPVDADYEPFYECPDGAVLWRTKQETGVGWYYHSTGEWSDIYDNAVPGVTHWMPLPDPPKEGDND